MAKRSVAKVLCAMFVTLVSVSASATMALTENGQRGPQSLSLSSSSDEVIGTDAQPATDGELTTTQLTELQGEPGLESRPDQSNASRNVVPEHITPSTSVEAQPSSPAPPSHDDVKPSDAAPWIEEQSTPSSTRPSVFEPQHFDRATTAPTDASEEPAKTTGTTSPALQPSIETYTSPDRIPQPPTLAVPPPPPIDPTVADVRTKLAEPSLGKGAASADLAALKAFYDELIGPPLWITTSGFSAKAQELIKEIERADDWGLPAEALQAPPAGDAPSTTEAQAIDELKLSLAVLKYARLARGGRISTLKRPALFDQRPPLIRPKTVLTEIAVLGDPASYLRGLHPKHEQFERLRQALLKARAGEDRAEIQQLVINMERWRWMPAELGSTYVWNNIPEFNMRVIKNGNTVFAERIIVGKVTYPTPIFSAVIRSIVFHPVWVVPPTIVKEDLKPALQQGDTTILNQRNLKVSLKGHPVDAEIVDWAAVNIREYTFIQPPGSANALGRLKFHFPNRHAVYMHDTPQRALFAETIRTLSHGCIRVREPVRLAALLLAEDRGWSAEQVESLIAREQSKVVKLNWPVPVHLTYFTMLVDENGHSATFPDVYKLDKGLSAALFGRSSKFKEATAEVN